MKKLIRIGLPTSSVAAFLLMLSCQDNFNEKDFLSLKAKQDSIAINKLALLNESGELLSFSVQVLEDKKPLEGVKVKLTNINTSDNAAAGLEVATNADGIALFPKVKYGAFNVMLSKTDYLSVTALITVDYPIVRDAENNIVPAKINESAVLSMMTSASAVSASTAIIKGRVTIESDLTNDKPEVPQNLTLKADLSGIGMVYSYSSNTRVEDYFVNEGNIGIAAVNANGEYSMVVPATAQGQYINMIYPVIELNQRVAVDHLDGKEITPEYRSVPTVFGRNIGYDDIPYIPGAKASITPSAPTTPGTGLEFGFSPYPRSLGNPWVQQSITSDFTSYGITFSLSNRGADYQSSPVFEFGTDANKAAFKSSLRGTVKSINVTNVGAGYPATVVATISYKENNSNVVWPLANFSISTVNGSLPSSITLPVSGTGFDPSTPFFTDFNQLNFLPGYDVKEFVVEFSGNFTSQAAATVTVNGEIDGIRMVSGGNGFTANPGDPAVTGGNGGTGGVFKIKKFTSRWNVNITKGGSGYKILPAGVEFAYINEYGNAGLDYIMLDKFNTTNDILNFLKTSSDAVVFIDPTSSYRTYSFSEFAPEPVITVSQSKTAKISALVGSTLNDADYGKININAIELGKGYDAPFNVLIEPTITGAPGSGASFKLVGFSRLYTNEYSWGGTHIMVNRGSGYLPNLNRVNEYLLGNPTSTTQQPFSGSTSVLVKSGATIINDVTYGTGNRKEKVFDVFN